MKEQLKTLVLKNANTLKVGATTTVLTLGASFSALAAEVGSDGIAINFDVAEMFKFANVIITSLMPVVYITAGLGIGFLIINSLKNAFRQCIFPAGLGAPSPAFFNKPDRGCVMVLFDLATGSEVVIDEPILSEDEDEELLDEDELLETSTYTLALFETEMTYEEQVLSLLESALVVNIIMACLVFGLFISHKW